MTTPPVYPETAQVADRHLENAINDLKDQVNKGFESVNKRLDDVVVKQTFDAVVDRLDAKIEHTDQRLKSDVHKLGERVESGAKTTKWVIGLAFTGAGLVSGVVFGIVNALG